MPQEPEHNHAGCSASTLQCHFLMWGVSVGVSPPAAQLARLCLSPTIPNPLWATRGPGIPLLCARYLLWTQGVKKSEHLNGEERRAWDWEGRAGPEGARFGETQQSWAQDLAAGHAKSERETNPEGLLPSAPTLVESALQDGSNKPDRTISKEQRSCGANSNCWDRAEEGLGQPPSPSPVFRKDWAVLGL